MGRIAIRICLTSLLLLFAVMGAGAGAAVEIGPQADWCQALNSLTPGGELILEPGQYRGPCTVRQSGRAGAPIVLRGRDPSTRPRIISREQGSNVFNLRASHLVIRGLAIGPTLPDVDAIRIYAGSDITIEGCRFEGVGGIAIVANHSSVRQLTVRANEIVNSGATAMYFGCHDGVGCAVTDLHVERNYVHGVWAQAGEVGYGVQIKLNSTGVIRDNVIVQTKGPGIMVYGAGELTDVSLVERNFVAGSRTSSAIIIGGGPAVVRNNIAVSSAEAGIGLENYGGRGLLRAIVVAHNTVYENAHSGIHVPAEGFVDALLGNNAVHAKAGTPALPHARIGVRSLGNVDCTWLPCFRDPTERDFSPVGLAPGLALGPLWVVSDDYFGRPRGMLPMVGALEGLARPIPLGIKPLTH